MEGQKELLGMWLSENEGAKFWLNVLNVIVTANAVPSILLIVLMAASLLLRFEVLLYCWKVKINVTSYIPYKYVNEAPRSKKPVSIPSIQIEYDAVNYRLLCQSYYCHWFPFDKTTEI